MSETEDNWEIQIWASYSYPKTLTGKVDVSQGIQIYQLSHDPLDFTKYHIYVSVTSQTEDIGKIHFVPPTATAPRLYLGK